METNQKDLNLVKRSFNQYIEVLKFLSKTEGELTLLDVGSQDSKLKNLLPERIKYKSLDMEGNVDYMCNLNTQKIPVKDKSFDIVVCLETLEHVFYPNKVIEELKRVVKDNGTIIISMPNEYNFYLRLNYLMGIKKNQIDEPFEIVSKLQHIHKPRVKDILDISNKHLKVIKIIPIWQSSSSTNSYFFYIIDKGINLLARVYPSLFSRLIVVIANK